MSDIKKRVTAIQGNAVKNEVLGAIDDGYILTWVGADEEWEALPLMASALIYGQAYDQGGPTLTVGTADVWYEVPMANFYTISSNTQQNGNGVQVLKAGPVLITASSSHYISTNAGFTQLSIYQNGSQIATSLATDQSAGVDQYASSTVSVIANAAVNDTFYLYLLDSQTNTIGFAGRYIIVTGIG